MIEKIREIEKAIEHECYYSALALALTIPDICGKVYCPTLNRNRKRYIKWFDDHVAHYYQDPSNTVKIRGTDIVFNGYACYLLRCAYLHSGNYDLKAQNSDVKYKEFQLGYKKSPHRIHMYNAIVTETGEVILNIDVSGLCKSICLAATEFYNNTSDKEKFSDSIIKYVNEGAGTNGTEKTD